MGDALDSATEKFLLNDKSPSRKVNEIDTRGSHFYLALYWAEALANQDKDAELKALFSKVSAEINSKEAQIIKELIDCQGATKEIGGYYMPNAEMAASAMRPSETLNSILDSMKKYKPRFSG